MKPSQTSKLIPEKTGGKPTSFPVLLIIAVLTGSLFYALITLDLTPVEVLCRFFFLLLLSVASVSDLKYRLIPNRLILLGITAWGVFTMAGVLPFINSLLTGTGAAFTLLLIRWAGVWLYQKKGMGMGDVKLLFVMGLFLEWNVFWALYLAITAGGLWSAAGLLLHKIDRSGRLPFAPFLLIGSILAIFLPLNRVLELWL